MVRSSLHRIKTVVIPVESQPVPLTVSVVVPWLGLLPWAIGLLVANLGLEIYGLLTRF